MSSEFETDTAVRADDGDWTGEIHPRWNVGSNPNGGYTLAMAARAMLAACDRPDPLSLTAHYVAPPAAGPVSVRCEVVRSGRRYATVGATMRQDGRELIRLLGAFGDLSAQQGPTRIAARVPAIAPVDDCVGMLALSGRAGAAVPEIMHRYDLRLDPACQWVRSRSAPSPDVAVGTAVGGGTADGPADPLEVAGWIRFADGTEPSVLGLLALADAFPPTLVGSVDVGWVPTVELTVHVRGRPAPGWVLGVSRTRFLVDGVLEQDAELWDGDGRLVALCRQMALVLPRR